jgi:multidrug efflux pump subunit AcrB
MTAIIRFLVNRSLVINLISVFLLLLGIATSFILIKREAFPNVNLDTIQIDAVYPGASPREVEQLVVTPIEQELRALNGIDKMISMSFPGSARITMEVDPDANNRTRLSSDIQLAIQRAKLPTDLPNDPVVTEVDGAVFPVIRLAITAPLTDLQLKRLGDNISDDLLNVKGVARVMILGDRKAEIRVVADPARMDKEHISVRDLTQALQGWNLNVPGGDLDTPEGQKSVRIVGEFSDAKDAASLVLRANERGDVLRLGDVAHVEESLVKATQYNDVRGQQGISMIILKKSDADIITTVDKIKDYIATVPKRYGAEVEVKTFQDFSRFARMRLGVLTSNGWMGLILVFISLLLFLRFSVAMTTTWGLPIIFMAGISLFYFFGLTLNLISMMGLIIVLGMLVDDAIVLGENITWHMERGKPPKEAAVVGTMEMMAPVAATIMTTIAAFVPMFFVSGIIGKFIVAIPIVVITLLVLSWLESFLFLPSHVAHFTNPNKHPPERRWLIAFENTYGWFLERAVKFRWTTVILSFAALFGTILLAKTLPFQLFPAVGIDEYIVRVTAPPGTSIDAMRDHLRDIDREMRAYIEPKYLQATLLKSGDVSVDEGDPLTQRGARYGMIRAIYEPAVSRPEHDALVDMRALEDSLPKKFPDFDITFSEIRPGPPLGRPLEAEITSYDDALAEKAANNLMAFLKTVKGVTSIDSGSKPGDDEIHVVLDRELATYAGVDLATASQQIRAAVGGLVVSTVRKGTEEIDVTIRFPEKGAAELKQLGNILIPNKRDGLIPLNKIARFEDHQGYTTIRHKEGIRIVNVVADIDANLITSVALNKLVKESESQWKGVTDDSVTVSYGGEQEKNEESFISLILAFGFALLMIFFILAIQFNSLGYPLIVMLAIPFGMVGIVLSFYLHSIFWKPMPLSFFSSLGMIALTGVVVNSSLVLLEFIKRAVAEGMEMHAAVIQAGRRRLRAVTLTSATTVLGLLPTAYGWGGMDPFVSPLALALSWGLLVSTFFTLLTIPAVVVAAYDVKVGVLKIFRRQRVIE